MRNVVCFLTAVLCLLTLLSRPTSAADRPNVLVIMADGARSRTCRCTAGERETPNIDRLASEGLTFQRAYLLLSPYCQPPGGTLHQTYRCGMACARDLGQPQGNSKPAAAPGQARLHRVGIAGKIHVKPDSYDVSVEARRRLRSNCVRNPTTARPDGLSQFHFSRRQATVLPRHRACRTTRSVGHGRRVAVPAKEDQAAATHR